MSGQLAIFYLELFQINRACFPVGLKYLHRTTASWEVEKKYFPFNCTHLTVWKPKHSEWHCKQKQQTHRFKLYARFEIDAQRITLIMRHVFHLLATQDCIPHSSAKTTLTAPYVY